MVARTVDAIVAHPWLFVILSVGLVLLLVCVLDWFIGLAERDDPADAREQALDRLFYPVGWPHCACGRPVLDGHVTCGRLECGTQAAAPRAPLEPLTDDDLVSLERALNHHQHRHTTGDARR